MRLVPVRGSVLCRKVEGGTARKTEGGVSVDRKSVDLYRIDALPEVPLDGFPFKVGDIVMSNSTGDEIEASPGDVVYVFKAENVMCKVTDEEEAH